ncbi:type II secretion system protein [Planococcus salinarum]|uniref:type II secretion system protein n=1 Tax=Planococcus salinarum TaxID=622695 RepID=UPI000E3D2870|nr:type II secretion system protein [Planococcus salinarum]TAA70477.1 type II secretion system protein [Planococcus salinarum]
MKNERGITLVELIAVLAIAGIVVALIASVLASGTNASQRTSMNQRLQQEGNIIVEKIRAEYLLNQQEDSIPDQFEILVQNDRLILSDGTGITMTLSEGYEYDLDPPAEQSAPSKLKTLLDRTVNSEFNLQIRGKSNENSDAQEYNINTSFSKLN